MTDIRTFYSPKIEKAADPMLTCKVCDAEMKADGHRTYSLPCGDYCKACLEDEHDTCKCDECKKVYGHDDCDFCKEEQGEFECEICGELLGENDYAGCCNDGDCVFGHERLCWGCCTVNEETGVPTCKKCVENEEINNKPYNPVCECCAEPLTRKELDERTEKGWKSVCFECEPKEKKE